MPGNEIFYEQLGRRIAALRRTLALSQEKLGERASVGSSYVAHIEIGSRKPTIDVLLKLADALGVPLWRLLTDDRLTPDEKAWDATSRELGARVQGLPQPDLQTLAYLAARLKAASSIGSVRHLALPAPGLPRRPAALAAEGSGREYKKTKRRAVAKARR